MKTKAQLLVDLNAFCSAHNVKETPVSMAITKSPGLFVRLRAGKDVYTGTLDSAYEYMAANGGIPE